MKSLNRSLLIQNGYTELYKIDLVNNRKELIAVNVFSLVLLAMMAIPGFFILDGYRMSFLHLLALVILIFLYIPAHELIHGAVIKMFSDEKLSFGWRLAYAYCGSNEAVFTKGEYIMVAVAPLVFFLIILSALQVLLPAMATVFYITDIVNVSGSAGDLYVVWRMLREKRRDILVNDTGTDMRVFSRCR